ncbi:MAG: hypothetical protein IJS08_15850 [Victivallales bacterium]|nr:hypothetical protein [Victivallales bacterium]
MNITLSIPNEIVENAREYAKRHNTSLNQLVREHLMKYSQEDEHRKIVEEAVAFFQQIAPTLPKGAKISRDEMERM